MYCEATTGRHRLCVTVGDARSTFSQFNTWGSVLSGCLANHGTC
jgi:hypothetical protein